MATAEVNGQSIYYEVHGDGEPLLCVMGLAADTLSWALNVPGFAERHRTIVFDNRDVGQSSMADSPYDLSNMPKDALALAGELEREPFPLLGVAMGGPTGQQVAVAAPERIRT